MLAVLPTILPAIVVLLTPFFLARRRRYAQTFDPHGGVCKTKSGMCQGCTHVREGEGYKARLRGASKEVHKNTNDRYVDSIDSALKLKTAMSTAAKAARGNLARKLRRCDARVTKLKGDFKDMFREYTRVLSL